MIFIVQEGEVILKDKVMTLDLFGQRNNDCSLFSISKFVKIPSDMVVLTRYQLDWSHPRGVFTFSMMESACPLGHCVVILFNHLINVGICVSTTPNDEILGT